MKRVTVSVDPRALVRRSLHRDYVEAMQQGRRQRATTFRSAKTYQRKPKHKEQGE